MTVPCTDLKPRLLSPPTHTLGPQDHPSVPAASRSGSSLDIGRRRTPSSTACHLLLSHKAHFPWLYSQHSLNATVSLSSLIICGLSYPVTFFLAGCIPFYWLRFHFNGVWRRSGVKYESHPRIMVKSTTSGANYPGFKWLLCYLPAVWLGQIVWPLSPFSNLSKWDGSNTCFEWSWRGFNDLMLVRT